MFGGKGDIALKSIFLIFYRLNLDSPLYFGYILTGANCVDEEKMGAQGDDVVFDFTTIRMRLNILVITGI